MLVGLERKSICKCMHASNYKNMYNIHSSILYRGQIPQELPYITEIISTLREKT